MCVMILWAQAVANGKDIICHSDINIIYTYKTKRNNIYFTCVKTSLEYVTHEPAPAPVLEPVADPEVEPPVAVVHDNIVRERSRSLSERQSMPLSRAKSMESLSLSPRCAWSLGGTSALRALFESKIPVPRELKRGGNPPQNFLPVNGDAQVKDETEERQDADEQVVEVMRDNNTHNPSALTSQGKEDTPKVRIRYQ